MTTAPGAATEAPTTVTAPVLPLPGRLARPLAAAGALLGTVATFLPWTWTTAFPGDLTVTGYPGGLQVLTLTGGLLTLLYAVAGLGVRGLGRLNPARSDNALLCLALGTFATTWYTVVAIASDLGGLVNVEPGGYLAAAGTLAAVVGALGLPLHRQAAEPPDPDREGTRLDALARGARRTARALRLTLDQRRIPDARHLPAWVQYAIIALAAAAGLGLFTYGIETGYGEIFTGFLLLAGFGAWGLHSSGLLRQYAQLTAAHRGFTATVGFLAAAAFPLTQSDDHNANLGVNILIFGTVALGLNIVVGLTGLLDLGYVAFLGVGAYAAALVSGSQFSAFSGTQFPFWAAMLTGAAASLVFGVLIGAPTLRLRGDYLAIVTLGFGEIFRIAVNSMDGVSGPDLTNGPDGIAQIPELDLFGFDFGASHDLGSFTIGRFSNYYLLMLLITVLVVLVFTRAADSRIGRAWVAIREDETAATAMGINGFRVKLVAFALGAALAGLAGTVSAHVTYNVVPGPYQFAGAAPPNSAFLLAAVVLGGMGTVSGPVLGAALLYLVPEKLAFLQDYELFAFGLALILLMRFRPEGVIPDRRRQLEFHQDATAPVPGQRVLGDDTVPLGKAGA
ncbi:branched-chain amino acid ABC transporter permease [Streptomyces sp. B1866]|uniref:branched-chain amino acid ABC transporter permease n=1 Tax=Streptomyces sp. B1866 TaxID=3075431 RepID=UPI00288D5FBD|nr:branched-chain amino acid ABC transporter permease [Streptomyces sp. B1866]MDT3399684.1 branched-chain amino acid ABC transporter permease [Streptomyces sp. B1866]